MEGGSVLGRTSAAKRRLSAPRALKTSSVGSAGVTLRWKAPSGTKPAYYVVLRDGKSLGKTTRTSFTDSKVKPGRTYRYSVRGYDAAKRAGRAVEQRPRQGPERAGDAAAVADDQHRRADRDRHATGRRVVSRNSDADGVALDRPRHRRPRRRRRRLPRPRRSLSDCRRRRRSTRRPGHRPLTPGAPAVVAASGEPDRGDGRPSVLARRLRSDAGAARPRGSARRKPSSSTGS